MREDILHPIQSSHHGDIKVGGAEGLSYGVFIGDGLMSDLGSFLNSFGDSDACIASRVSQNNL
jgi:hypothetical protein